jgi:hypothetical protein
LKNLSQKEMTSLQMLEYLSRDDSALRGELKEALMPLFKQDGDAGFGMMRNFIEPYAQAEMEANSKRLGEENLSRGERLKAIDENIAMQPFGAPYSESAVTAELMKNLKGGLATKGTETATDMLGTIRSDINLFKAYSQIAPPDVPEEGLTPYWTDFKDILGRVGGEDAPSGDAAKDEENARARLFGQKDLHHKTTVMNRFDTALDIHLFIQESAAQGIPREKALAHALECSSFGMDPRSTPMEEKEEKPPTTVEVEHNSDEFVIDGIRLKINDEN